ncbi:MAG: hypothetical protein C0424_00555 [Sphingobacteriaceae bacterium]|nr:hypothetical protein [Sphingobacteriaceae bacterium]
MDVRLISWLECPDRLSLVGKVIGFPHVQDYPPPPKDCPKGGLSSFMDQFYVYILFSESLNRYYIGHTGQLDDHLFGHTD